MPSSTASCTPRTASRSTARRCANQRKNPATGPSLTRTTPSDPLKPSTGELSAIIGMLSAIDRNQCPQSIGTPVRNPRNPHDKRVLKLIRSFLTAGVLAEGLVSPTEEGTPQGGPLSPLLSNLMLDVLDKELEKRGHRFVRYADDCNIYVRSQKAGERVMAGIEVFLAK